MIPCLHPTTVGRSLDLPEYLALAEATGFSLVDWDATDIARRIERDGETAVVRLFHDHQVAWAGFGLPVDLFSDEQTFAEALAGLEPLLQAARLLGSTRAMTWLWPSIDQPPVPVALRIIERVRRIADQLAAYDIRFGLEFVGPHHLRHKAYPLLYTLSDLLALIEAIDRPNVGVLLDSYHWYTSESNRQELDRLKTSNIVEVHINDAHLGPQEANDHERCLPGEGQIDLPTFLGYLAEGGYEGPLSLEILRTAPPSEAPEVVAERAFSALTRLIKEASSD